MEAAVIDRSIQAPVHGDKTAHRKLGMIVSALLGVLVVAILYSIAVGAVRVPIRTVLSAVLGHQSLSREQHVIILEIRLPRVLAGALVGALSVAGLLFQGLFRNPLADPYVIGSSGGAVMGPWPSSHMATNNTGARDGREHGSRRNGRFR